MNRKNEWKEEKHRVDIEQVERTKTISSVRFIFVFCWPLICLCVQHCIVRGLILLRVEFDRFECAELLNRYGRIMCIIAARSPRLLLLCAPQRREL